jgi:predicted heme/steroid binding protein
MILKFIGIFIICTMSILAVRAIIIEKDAVDQKETKFIVQLPPKNSPLLPAQGASADTTQVEEQKTSKAPDILPSYSASSLAIFNGTDEAKPIYIALEGNVYDVTEGKKFYAPGGVYHFLAGTDGTTLLKVMGGDIIKKKYPVVGTFSK